MKGAWLAATALLSGVCSTDASAWSVGCYDDATEDRRTCVVDPFPEILTNDFRVYVWSDLGTSVSVGHENVPGSFETVRIDENRPIRWDTTNESAPTSVVQQMIAGNILRYRWSEWPSGRVVDGQVSLTGFTSAYKEAKQRAAAYRR